MSNDFDIVQLLVIVVVVSALVLPTMAVLNEISSQQEDRRDELSVQTNIFGNEYASLYGSNITGVSVKQSLGDAASLEGSDSVTLSSEPDTSDSWALATNVWVNNSTGDRMVYSDSTRMLVYNGSTNEWVGVYYNESSGETFTVRELADSPADRTSLVLELNATGTLFLREDDTDVSQTDTSTASPHTGELTAENLEGALDETRLVNGTMTAAERQEYNSTPTAPIASMDHVLRVMYDSYDKTPSSLSALYFDGSATVAGAELVSGVAGEPTQEGTDYNINDGNIRVLAGGSLEDAPVVFAEWTGDFSAFTGLLETVIDLLPLFVALLLLVFVLEPVMKRVQ